MKRYLTFGMVVMLLTIVLGSAYGMSQQILRLSANDPQIQLAHEVATQLNDGAQLDNVVGGYKVDMAQSLAPFVLIYDKQGSPIAGTGYLDGARAKVPIGVLKAAENTYDHRVTWQPKDTVRIASVTVATKNYYVLAGRSVREVEAREQRIFQIALSSWIAALLVTIVGFVAREYYGRRSFN